MTNWCHNEMKISGPVEEVERFKRTCIRVLETSLHARQYLADEGVAHVVEEARKWKGHSGKPTMRDWVLEQIYFLIHGPTLYDWDRWERWLPAATRPDPTEAEILAEYNFEPLLDFNAIIPIRESATTIAWTIAHWGTKWNAGFTSVLHDKLGEYHCRFSTAYTAPIGIYYKLAEMFPTLKFELSGLEMDLNYAYEGTIENGEVDFVEGNGEGGGAPCH